MVTACSAGTPLTATIRARSDGTWCIVLRRRAGACTTSSKRGKLVVLDIDEEEAGRVGGKLLLDLVLHVALDQRDRGQRRQPQAGGQQQQRRRRAGPVQVADAQAGPTATATPAPTGRAASTADPPARNSARVRPAPTQKYSANARSVAVSHGQRRPGQRASAALTAIRTADGRVASGTSPSRNSAPPGMRAARPSGQRAKQSAISRP